MDLSKFRYIDDSDRELIEKTQGGHVDQQALAQLLYKIHKSSDLFYYGKQQTDLDSEGRNIVAVLIGEALLKVGGVELMESVARLFPDQSKSYLLSHAWDGIGWWRA